MQALLAVALGLPPAYFRRLPQTNGALNILTLAPPKHAEQQPSVTLECLNQVRPRCTAKLKWLAEARPRFKQAPLILDLFQCGLCRLDHSSLLTSVALEVDSLSDVDVAPNA